jgi:hypothetical protein
MAREERVLLLIVTYNLAASATSEREEEDGVSRAVPCPSRWSRSIGLERHASAWEGMLPRWMQRRRPWSRQDAHAPHLLQIQAQLGEDNLP